MKSPPNIAAIQEGFEKALPRINRVARFRLRHLDAEAKEDAISEVLAICWQAYRRLVEQGRDVAPLVQKIAEFATRRVRTGRLFVNTRVRDVLAPQPRQDHLVESIPLSEDDAADPLLIDALADRNAPSPADEAALRIDYAEWLKTLDWRKRHLVQQLGRGLNTVEVGKREGVGGAAISMMRQKLAETCPLLDG